ncbi:hypothetical protein A2U01_0058585, partial [Trifolium medium]|nr:hypothetical protein [Trifolium medium]
MAFQPSSSSHQNLVIKNLGEEEATRALWQSQVLILFASLDASNHKSSSDLALCGRSIRELADRKHAHDQKTRSLERTWNN